MRSRSNSPPPAAKEVATVVSSPVELLMKARSALANFREEIEKQSKIVDGKLQLPRLEPDKSSPQILEDLEWMEQFVQRRKLSATRKVPSDDVRDNEQDETGAVRAKIEDEDI